MSRKQSAGFHQPDLTGTILPGLQVGIAKAVQSRKQSGVTDAIVGVVEAVEVARPVVQALEARAARQRRVDRLRRARVVPLKSRRYDWKPGQQAKQVARKGSASERHPVCRHLRGAMAKRSGEQG